MLSVSSAFKSAISNASRSIKGAAIVHFLGQQTFPFATATASSQFDVTTPPSQACNGRFGANNYTCSGALPSALSNQQKGWWGTQVSGSGGSITPEVLTVTYPTPIIGGNIVVIGMIGFYPVDFTIQRNGVTIATVVGNTNYKWSMSGAPVSTSTLTLTVTKIAPASANIHILQFGLVASVVFEGADLVDMVVLEEISSDVYHPVGLVSSNECTMNLTNTDNRFTARNTHSPFYGMNLSGLVMQPFIGVVTSSNNCEFVPLGTFYSGDWTSPNDTTEVSTVGYDMIYNMLSIPVPEIPISINTTIIALFTQLFTAMGLTSTQYYIDSSLTTPVPYGFIPTGTFQNVAQALATAGNCCVYMSRTNIMTVRPIINTSSPVASYTDAHISIIDNPQLNRSTYQAVNMSSFLPTIQDASVVAQITGLAIPIGTTVFSNISFTGGPILTVLQTILSKAVHSTLDNFTWSPWSITLTITSTAAETIDIYVYGNTISGTTAATTQNSSVAAGQTLSIDSPLIQSTAIATTQATALTAIVNNPLAMVTVTMVGDPSMELLDVITLSSPTDQFLATHAVTLSNTLTYNGGLSEVTIARANS